MAEPHRRQANADLSHGFILKVKILALDTSTDACSAAVWVDGDVVERFELGGRHSERILTMVHEVLAESGLTLSRLDAVAFGRGPGSFTGLRIAAGVAQGLAFGADIPVAPVSSLAALAQGVDAPKVLAAIDARMNQVYSGAYVKNGEGNTELFGNESVMAPSELPLPAGNDWVGAGSGWDQYHPVLLARLGGCVIDWRRQVYPRARHVGRIGAVLCQSGTTLPAERALPVYIRDDVAVKMKIQP